LVTIGVASPAEDPSSASTSPTANVPLCGRANDHNTFHRGVSMVPYGTAMFQNCQLSSESERAVR
jgi:hypothetical protein